MADEIDGIEHDDDGAPRIIDRALPRQHGGPCGKAKDNRPRRPEQPIGRLKTRLFQVTIPWPDGGEQTPRPAQDDGPSDCGDGEGFRHGDGMDGIGAGRNGGIGFWGMGIYVN